MKYEFVFIMGRQLFVHNFKLQKLKISLKNNNIKDYEAEYIGSWFQYHNIKELKVLSIDLSNNNLSNNKCLLLL